jgi:hypothetical protein
MQCHIGFLMMWRREKEVVASRNNHLMNEDNATTVTPDFPKKTKCKPICMPGSSFMHMVT